MGTLSAVLRSIQYPEGRGVMFWCPGCRNAVALPVEGPRAWQWDGNVERPTLSPSVLSRGVVPLTDEQHARYLETGELPPRVPLVCHSFVKAGMIEFLTDSTHELAGRTVPIPEWPKNFADGGEAP